jgi:hypothetical protein
MQNQVAKFVAPPTADELVVAVRQSKKQILLSVKHYLAETDKTSVGMQEWFELGKDTDAQKAFDARVQQAEQAGWQPAARTTRPAQFAVMPSAPTKPMEVAKPRAASGGRK